MATSPKARTLTRKSDSKSGKQTLFAWTATNRSGQKLSGQIGGVNATAVKIALRKKGLTVQSIKQKSLRFKKITPREIATLTRQISTMLRSGLPIVNALDVLVRGSINPSVSNLLVELRSSLEAGSSLGNALREHPQYFNAMFCSLVDAGEIAGILDSVMERLAIHLEKLEAIKRKIRGALMYPIAVLVIALCVVTIIMIKVIPAFKELFSSFGAELPAPTLVVIAISDFTVKYGIFLAMGIVGIWLFIRESYRRSPALQDAIASYVLRAPLFGSIITSSCIARWSRTLGTMFAAGVPLVEALETVGAATGNRMYEISTDRIRKEVSAGTSLSIAMQTSNLFPAMVLQMIAIGEEAGSLDSMLNKIAEIYEEEVDDRVKTLSTLMEPLLMAFLGILVGGLMIAMYAPIFSIGQNF